VTHSATFDFWPATRHALRATPHGERPTSVADYEAATGQVAKDRQLEIWRAQGVDVDTLVTPKKGKDEKTRGYND
jgi:sulfonate dioxygenase